MHTTKTHSAQRRFFEVRDPFSPWTPWLWGESGRDMTTMRAVIKTKAAPGASLEKTDVPACGPEDVLLKVKATSICGTDLHIYNWDRWAQSVIKPPLVIGHEIAGEVVEIGSRAEGLERGDLVSVE